MMNRQSSGSLQRLATGWRPRGCPCLQTQVHEDLLEAKLRGHQTDQMQPRSGHQGCQALVPRPKLHLIRFHGVLAPNAKLRALVVPQEPEAPAHKAKPAECEAGCAHHRPVRLSWAKLLKRVFDLDLEHCPDCGGELKIIAAILEQPVIEKILTHLGLQARAPPARPAPRWRLRIQPCRPRPRRARALRLAQTVHRTACVPPQHHVRGAVAPRRLELELHLAGIAAALACPGRTVVVATGDGAFGFNAMEIDTAAHHQVPVLIVVANNGSWAIEVRDQQENHGEVVGTRLQFADHAAMARAFGLHGERVERAEELDGAIERALAALAKGKPTLLDVLVTPEAASSDARSGLAWVPDLQALGAWDAAERAWRQG